MAVRAILRMGESFLLQKSQQVEQFDVPELHQLIQDLEDTMSFMNGAGIAAPQIGVGLRVVIFGQKPAPLEEGSPDEAAKNPRYPEADAVPYTVLINPTITPLGDELEDGWEGCLSVPGLRGIVPRHTRVHYTGVDQFGHSIDRLVSGFHARVVQHECDHLEGILYPMRIQDFRNFGYTRVLFPNQDIQDD
ncbi:MAG: peptide deformylase [Methylophilaceae bacterium]